VRIAFSVPLLARIHLRVAMIVLAAALPAIAHAEISPTAVATFDIYVDGVKISGTTVPVGNPTGSIHPVAFFDTSTGSPTWRHWTCSCGYFYDGPLQGFGYVYFTSPGDYTVTLTTYWGAISATTSKTITAQAQVPSLTAAFSYSPASPSAGQLVTFTDQSTPAPSGWQWNFGDGSTSTAQNPTHAFAQGSYNVTLTVTAGPSSNSITKTVVVSAAGSSCIANDTTLCLAESRFAVTAQWATGNSQTGSGHGVKLTSDTGYFWFFGASNVEVVVKVLNGCVMNPGRFWVFTSGMTNVNVVLTVRDTKNGTVKTFTNALNNTFDPILDTSAFATCP
jgi:PKD repeat protein